MELLQENLGIKFKKARKRIKMGSEDEDSGDDEREGREELPDIDEVRLSIVFYTLPLYSVYRSFLCKRDSLQFLGKNTLITILVIKNSGPPVYKRCPILKKKWVKGGLIHRKIYKFNSFYRCKAS